jgi:hypothetical protein
LPLCVVFYSLHKGNDTLLVILGYVGYFIYYKTKTIRWDGF